MSKQTCRRIAAVSFALLAAAQLSGCGGGDDAAPTATTPPPSGNNPNPPPPPPPVGSATGVFVDSPVQGLSYTTAPSNLSGVTNASGEFTYNPGDTVTFALGDLVFGSVPAQGVVTPLTVAEALVASNPSADVETITVNMLTFLQSFDADGDASNGITISSAVAATFASNEIDFVADAGAFDAALMNLVAAVESEAQVELSVVSRAQAVEHFTQQAPALLAGTYVLANQDGEPVTQNTATLTLFASGAYLYGGHDNDPNCDSQDANGNGVERGTYVYNPVTRALTFTETFETNGSCGPGTEAGQLFTLSSENNVLQLQIEGESTYLVAAPSTAGALAGSWVLPPALLQGRPEVITFFPTSEGMGRYFVADSYVSQDDASAGIEEGCYSLTDGQLSVDLNPNTCAGAVDTNEDAGLSHPQIEGAPFYTAVDAHGRLRIREDVMDDEGYTDLVRLPLQTFTHADRAGVWYHDAGVEPQDDADLFVIALFEDGRYLMGGVENDVNCNTGAMNEDADGNGAEYGQLTASGDRGVVTADATQESNGSCGFDNGLLTEQQRYLFVRSAVEGSMILYAYDSEMGAVLTRVPSTPNGLVGAWVADGDTANPYMTVFLPEGLLFDVSAAEGDEMGIFRWRYEVTDGDTLTLTSGGDECIDTTGDYDSCVEDIVETPQYLLDGGALSIDYGQEFGVFEYTKLTP